MNANVFLPLQQFCGNLSLSVSNAATLLRLSQETIYELCKSGVLEGVWVEDSLQVSTESILDYLLSSALR